MLEIWFGVLFLFGWGFFNLAFSLPMTIVLRISYKVLHSVAGKMVQKRLLIDIQSNKKRTEARRNRVRRNQTTALPLNISNVWKGEKKIQLLL